MMSRRRWYGILAALLVALGLAIFVALNLGASHVTLWDTSHPQSAAILWQARWPRIVLALLVGVALSSSGTAYQALLRNPLADPYILGVSGGAAIGSAIGIWCGASSGTTALLAGGVSLLAMLVISALARGPARAYTHSLLLTGVVCNAFAFAILLLLYTLAPSEKSQQILSLMMGNIGVTDGTTMTIMAGMIGISLSMLLWRTRAMDALALGDETAASLGVPVAQLQREIFVAGALGIGAAVAVSGLIGFVGLFIPHATRLLVGHTHRRLLPAATLLGASFLILADTAARTLFTHGSYQTELPVGVITALIGAPCFVWLMKRQVATP